MSSLAGLATAALLWLAPSALAIDESWYIFATEGPPTGATVESLNVIGVSSGTLKWSTIPPQDYANGKWVFGSNGSNRSGNNLFVDTLFNWELSEQTALLAGTSPALSASELDNITRMAVHINAIAADKVAGIAYFLTWGSDTIWSFDINTVNVLNQAPQRVLSRVWGNAAATQGIAGTSPSRTGADTTARSTGACLYRDGSGNVYFFFFQQGGGSGNQKLWRVQLNVPTPTVQQVGVFGDTAGASITFSQGDMFIKGTTFYVTGSRAGAMIAAYDLTPLLTLTGSTVFSAQYINTASIGTGDFYNGAAYDSINDMFYGYRRLQKKLYQFILLPNGQLHPAEVNTVVLYSAGGTPQTSFPGDFGDMSDAYYPLASDPKPGSIGNRIWLDENSNGLQDAGETGIPDATVELYESTGTTVLATTVTDLDGGYLFDDLALAMYVVKVKTSTMPAALAANPTYDPDGTLNHQTSVTLNAATPAVDTADFGYNWSSIGNVTGNTGTGAIGDRVWVDTNGNGLQDPGESGLGNIPVALKGAGADGLFGTADDTTVNTTTDVAGNYIFTAVPAGAYQVVVNGGSTPSDYTLTGDPDATPDNRTTTPIVLAPGDVYLNADFGYQPTGASSSIGDLVFFDADADGTVDAGTDYGIAGVSVALLNATGQVIATTLTDATGAYLFTGLAVGTYTVAVNDTLGVVATLRVTVDPDAVVDGQSTLTVNGTSAYLDVDFGYTAPDQNYDLDTAIIGDTIFLDRDGSGSPGAGEGLEGVSVSLYDATDTVLQGSTVTDANGHYYFGGLAAGTYVVRVDPTTLPGTAGQLTNTTDPDGGTVNESSVILPAGGTNLAQDFGYRDTTTPNTISGTIWYDVNADGSLVGGETGRFVGVTVVLRDSNGDVVATTTTDGSGNYSFSGLPDGTYQVDVTDTTNVLDGLWKSTGGTPGADNNSQADPYSVTVSSGASNTTADFGYYDGRPAGLGDFVWFDINDNGIQDASELGVSDAVVSLAITYPNATVVTLKTTTDGSGLYSFGNLLLDENFRVSGSGSPTFSLSVATPSGFTPTAKFLQGSDPAKDSQNPAGAAATVTKGANDPTYDFAFTGNGGTIGDRVFLDLNNNSEYDPGEGIAGVSVALSGGATATATTDANGFYQFSNLPIATGGTSYTVTVNGGSAPNGLTLSHDPQGGADNQATYTLTTAAPFVDTADFGYRGTGAVGDRVFIDLNNNNAWDAGEGISGVPVTLAGDVDGDGAAEALTTTTDADGYYQFTNLRTTSGGVSYTVTVNGGTAPNGLTQSFDPDGTLNNATAVALTTGTPSVQTADFGYKGNGAVGDRVFTDSDRNNAYTAGEGINGVTVTLTGDVDGDGIVETVTVTTATGGSPSGSGYYQFSNLRTSAAGVAYTVKVTSGLPPGVTQTVDPDGTLDGQTTVTLTSTQNSNQTADFGYLNAGAIGDRIFLDANNNNQWDPGEGIAGVTVTLSGGASQTTTTTADGDYQFGNLPVSGGGTSYTVTVSGVPTGLTQSYDLDGTLNNATTVSLTTANPSVQTADFGYKGTGAVGDRVFVDLNNNNAYDAGEGIADAATRLTGDINGDGVGDSLTTTTDANGYYQFSNLRVPTSGSVSLTVTVTGGVPTGLTQTFDPDGTLDAQTTVALSTGTPSVQTADFGYQGSGAVGDRVFADLNSNNQFDTGEGIAGATVTLTGDVDGDGASETLTTTTDATGYYQFSKLRVPPTGSANYTVVVTAGVPSGMTQSYDPDGTKDNQTTVALTTAAPSDQTADFGYQGSATIGNLVFQDFNDNGQVDAGDTGINGVTVELWNSGGDGQIGGGDDTLMSTTTTANVGGVDGTYSFRAQPGSYYVKIPTPPATSQLNSTPTFTSGDNRDHGSQAGGSGTVVTTAVITLAANQTDNTQDVGFVPNSQLETKVGGGGLVFKDNNLNGTFDAGDGRVTGLNVELYQDDGDGVPEPGADDTLVTSVASDTDGRVLFKLLPPGDYFMRIPAAAFQSGGALAGWLSFVGVGDPNDGTDDSGAGGTGPSGDENGIDDPNPAVNGINSGVFTLSVGGEPVNGSGGTGGSETGDGRLTDDALGDSNNDLTIDFAFAESNKLGSVGDFIWADLDGDGAQDSGEPGLPNMKVFVDLNNSGTLDDGEPSATTDGAGAYTIPNLPAGNYDVRVDPTTLPLGAVQTYDLDGTLDNEATAVALTATEDRTDVDFGYRGTSQIGNQVWEDTNNDGLLNGAETGINGVTVRLDADLNKDGDFGDAGETGYASQATSGNGNYSFTGLFPGNYQMVIVTPPSGAPLSSTVTDTADNQEDNDDNGSQPGGVATTVFSPVIALGVGETDNTVDFGFVALASIGDWVWVDENSDGYQDAGEPGLPNVQVNLYDTNGALVATTVTDSQGGYLFPNLPGGTYYVDVLDGTSGQPNTLPAGMTQTPPSTLPGADFGNQDHGTTAIPTTTFFGYPVALLAGGENLTADFGYNWNPSGSPVAALGDRVWIDLNGDGAQQPDEVGVSGVTVQLFTAGADGLFGTGDDVAGPTTTTDANGNYLFDGLAPGAYVVKVTSSAGASHDVLGTGYSQTGDPDHFGMTGTNNDNQTTRPVVLGPGDVFLNADFGYQPQPTTVLGRIGDLVWFDADGSGTATPDAGEYGIAGVTVALIKDSNGNGVWDGGELIVASTTTDANGQYLFSGLPLDDGDGDADYIVWVNDTANVLAGLVQTYDHDAPLNNVSATALTTAAPSDLNQDCSYALKDQQPTDGLIGDTIWLDNGVGGGTAGNGLQDGTEPGIEGVVVELYDSTGTTLLATTVTDENGRYYFGNLDPNATCVVKVAASNFAPGGVLAGLTQTGDPEGVGSLDNKSTVNLGTTGGDGVNDPDGLNNGINLGQDFGYLAPSTATGSIGNLVWLDTNADGVRQASETGIEGVTLDLYRDLNGNGTVDPGEPRIATTTTDGSGNYLFSGLSINDGSGSAKYVVDVTDTAGVLAGYWHSLGDQAVTADDNSKVDPYAVTLSTATPNVLTVDFGYYVEPAALGNYVWLDNNGNGIQDTTETGIANVEVQLTITYPDGTVTVLKTLTDANGFYSFGNLLQDEDYNGVGAGEPTFKLQVTTPWSTGSGPLGMVIPTALNQGSNPMLDSNDPANTAAFPVKGLTDVSAQSPTSNETDPVAGYDFGFKPRPPTAARLACFKALSTGPGTVQLAWGTLLENNVLGFRVDRSTADGGWQRITAQMIPATGWDGRPQTYGLVDAHAPAGTDLTYRLVEVNLNGQESVLAEATVEAGLTTGIAQGPDGLSLSLRGAPNASVTVETAATVEGPWSRVKTLTLDGAGAGTVNLGREQSRPVRFYRVLNE